MKTLLAFLLAVTEALRAYRILAKRSISKEIDNYQDEKFTLADSGTPADKLRIELINEREDRAREQLRSL